LQAEEDIVKKLSPKKIILPVLLGVAVAALLLYFNLTDTRFEEVTGNACGNYEWVDTNKDGMPNTGEADEFTEVGACEGNYQLRTYKDTLSDINWNLYSSLWILAALVAMAFRDLAYMYRIKVLTDDKLSWGQSFRVIMLWEFASALTPSIVGGSGIAMFILNRENIKLGKSTAIVLVSALLDEFFYISMVAVVLLSIGTANIFPEGLQRTLFGVTFGTQGIFWLGYGFILLLTTSISIGVFFVPRTIKYVLLQLFRLPILRRWRYSVIQVGDDIITTSKELRHKPKRYWIKALISTYISWTGRYLVVNFLILAFINPDNPLASTFSEHVLIYARQLVMWVIMLISPTPGSSGVAEFAFSGFLKEFIPLGLVGALALLWRLVSYYPYLFIGAIILPRWLRSTAKNTNRDKKQDS
jgi:uncharacterized membrane protein YbhN (UPF0104 family)